MIKKLLVFFILLNSSTLFSISSIEFANHSIEMYQEKAVVVFSEGVLYFKGFTGQGSFQIYSIIGNKIVEMNVRNFSQFQFNTSFKMGNMYIIRVIIKDKAKTFKIIAS